MFHFHSVYKTIFEITFLLLHIMNENEYDFLRHTVFLSNLHGRQFVEKILIQWWEKLRTDADANLDIIGTVICIGWLPGWAAVKLPVIETDHGKVWKKRKSDSIQYLVIMGLHPISPKLRSDVTIMKSRLFPCLHPFYSAVQVRQCWHACDANTSQALLLCDVIKEVWMKYKVKIIIFCGIFCIMPATR